MKNSASGKCIGAPSGELFLMVECASAPSVISVTSPPSPPPSPPPVTFTYVAGHIGCHLCHSKGCKDSCTFAGGSENCGYQDPSDYVYSGTVDSVETAKEACKAGFADGRPCAGFALFQANGWIQLYDISMSYNRNQTPGSDPCVGPHNLQKNSGWDTWVRDDLVSWKLAMNIHPSDGLRTSPPPAPPPPSPPTHSHSPHTHSPHTHSPHGHKPPHTHSPDGRKPTLAALPPWEMGLDGMIM